MARASWRYDEMCQTGVDFDNVDRVAQYDEQQGSDREAERELVERLGIIPGHVVLDLGCGTGSFACEAARSGAQVRAIDVSKAMLEFVQGTALREGIPEIKVEHSGFLTLEASPNSVDVVVSRYALHHLPDFWKQVALLRLREVLRPTGKFYLRDVVFSFEAEDYEASVESWFQRMQEESGFSREDCEAHVREEYSTYTWVLEGFLERAGFQIVEKSYPGPEYAEYICVPSAPAV